MCASGVFRSEAFGVEAHARKALIDGDPRGPLETRGVRGARPMTIGRGLICSCTAGRRRVGSGPRREPDAAVGGRHGTRIAPSHPRVSAGDRHEGRPGRRPRPLLARPRGDGSGPPPRADLEALRSSSRPKLPLRAYPGCRRMFSIRLPEKGARTPEKAGLFTAKTDKN